MSTRTLSQFKNILTLYSAGFIFFIIISFTPFRAYALIPFGGLVGTIIPCMSGSIHTTVGPPVGGVFIWTPATRTYLYGPPSPGRWVLGYAGPPSICVVSLNPPIFFTGLVMLMVGTSAL